MDDVLTPGAWSLVLARDRVRSGESSRIGTAQAQRQQKACRVVLTRVAGDLQEEDDVAETRASRRPLALAAGIAIACACTAIVWPPAVVLGVAGLLLAFLAGISKATTA